MKEKESKELGKAKWTLQMGNNFWIKGFEEGAKLRKKNEGEITLQNHQLIQLAFQVREMASLFTRYELELIRCKFPQTSDFLYRLEKRQVSYEEGKKIVEGYNTKLKMAEKLEGN